MFCTVLFAGITITTLVITRVSPILIALCVVCTKHKESSLIFCWKVENETSNEHNTCRIQFERDYAILTKHKSWTGRSTHLNRVRFVIGVKETSQLEDP